MSLLQRWMAYFGLSRLQVSDFHQVRTKETRQLPHLSNQTFFDNVIHYYNKNNHEIGYIHYNTQTGQIGLIWLNPHYHHLGLGSSILSDVFSEMKQNGLSEAWLVTNKDHSVWSTMARKYPVIKWKDPAHSSVTGSGYVFPINFFELQK